MNIEYKVEAYNTKSKTLLIRSAPDADSARRLANIFIKAPELIQVGFGWNGNEPIVNEVGIVPECIWQKYLDEIVMKRKIVL